MLIVFKKNIGTVDAAKYGLDFQQCLAGVEVSVSDRIGEQIVKRKLAEAVVDLKAVPPVEIKASKAEVVIETKQETAVPQPVIQTKKFKEK